MIVKKTTSGDAGPMTMRMAGAMIVLATLLLSVATSGPSSGGDSIQSPVGASAQRCPVGQSTATFLVFVRCPRVQWEGLFGRGRMVRVLEEKSRPFTIRSARQVLSLLTNRPDSLFDVAICGISYSNGPISEARVIASGDGMAFVARTTSTGVRVSLCALQNGIANGRPACATLSDDQLLIVKLLLDAEPVICLMKATNLPSDADTVSATRFSYEREAFRDNYGIQIKNPLLMRVEEPSLKVQQLLAEMR